MLRTTFTCCTCSRYVTEDGAVDEAVCARCRHARAAIANALKPRPTRECADTDTHAAWPHACSDFEAPHE